MNILDIVDAILGMSGVFLGLLPDKPDKVISLFEYSGESPTQYFDRTDYIYYIQARTRGKTANEAYTLAKQIQDKLNGFDDSELTISQVSNILPLGQDDNNPPRWEYTVNFKIMMKG